MKVYWAEGRGAIITSANLSTNALGSGDLKEVGVLLSDEDIDIDHLISSLKLRNPSKKELSDLDRLHDLFYVKNPPVRKKRQVPTFETWYQSIAPRLWKLGWADEGTEPFSRSAKEIAKQDYGLSPYWFVACKKNDFRKEDWVLTFMLRNNAATELAWMFVDYIVPVARMTNVLIPQGIRFKRFKLANQIVIRFLLSELIKLFEKRCQRLLKILEAL